MNRLIPFLGIICLLICALIAWLAPHWVQVTLTVMLILFFGISAICSAVTGK